MSQDINQSDVQLPGDENPPRERGRNNIWIYLLIIVALLGSNIYFFFSRSKMAKEAELARSGYVSADSARAAIEIDYSAALARLDDLVSKNTALNNEITDKDGEIEKMKKELRGLMSKRDATAADLGRARALIEQLNSKTRVYEERIAELEHENEQLISANVNLGQQRDSAVAEREQLQRLGSVLSISNIRMQPIDLRRGGKKEKETGKASKVDVFRIYFDIVENRVTTGGDKEFFLRITDPEGNLLSNAAYGSGITADAEGVSFNYTLRKNINLQKGQALKDVTLDWQQDSEYKKGDYTIEIYNEGIRVGRGSVSLR